MAKTPVNVHIGNTTFRRPWRIPEGLRALNFISNTYPFSTKRKSSEFEKTLEKELVKREVIDSSGTTGKWTGSFARKFLNLCQHFGFITPRPKVIHGKGEYYLDSNGDDFNLINLKKDLNENIKISLKPFSITPLGNLLMNTESDGKELNSEQKDIFLKSLFNQIQPSILQPYSSNYEGEKIKLIKIYIDILLDLESRGKDKYISQGEMAGIINRYKKNNVKEIVDEILDYRNKKEGKEINFSRKWYKEKAGSDKYFATSLDYADINFSYSVCTGLFKKRGRKVVINEDKIDIAKEISLILVNQKQNNYEYISNIWSGNLMPFENQKVLTKSTVKIIDTLKSKYNYSGFNDESKNIDSYDSNKIKKIFFRVSDKLDERAEFQYYLAQKEKANEILEFLNNAEDKIVINDEQIKPKPEHLEWIFWRAFLAINSFDNPIKTTRGFPIDDDFLPTHFASGGKEDLIFEFETFKLIIEVTYKTGGPQFRDEHEPVFRHMINRMNEDLNKPVYCLFVAPNINNNTARGFKDYFYNNKNEKIIANIIPMEIKQFAKIFESLFITKKILTPNKLKEIFDDTLNQKDSFEPLEWMQKINTVVEKHVK